MSIDRRVAALAAAAAWFACAGAPVQLYPGPARPAAEVSVLRDAPEARVVAVDGRRVAGSAWALLPGPREVWLEVVFQASQPDALTWCAVNLRAVAGEEYRSRTRAIEVSTPGSAPTRRIEVGIADAGDVLRAIPRACTAVRPELVGGARR